MFLVFGNACAHEVSVQSIPTGAEVYVGEKSLGRTPINLDEASLAPTHTSYGYRVILKKEGYRDTTLILPDSYGQVAVTAYLGMDDQRMSMGSDAGKLAGKEILRLKQKSEADLAKMLEEQLKLFNGEVSDINWIKKMQKDYPEASLPMFLESLYFRKKGDKKAALVAAENALGLFPEENDYAVLIQMLGGEESK